MKIDPLLHHYAQQITRGTLEDVLEMYEKLGLEVVYRPIGDMTWAMVGQPQLDFSIQVVEYDAEPIKDAEIKKRSHIAFLSDDPQAVITMVKQWAESKQIVFREGGWSERERYFDLSEVFINFVVEVMHTSITEE